MEKSNTSNYLKTLTWLIFHCVLYMIPIYLLVNIWPLGLAARIMTIHSLLFICLLIYAMIYFATRRIGNKVMLIPLSAVVGVVFCLIASPYIGESIVFFTFLFIEILIVTLTYSAGILFYKAVMEL